MSRIRLALIGGLIVASGLVAAVCGAAYATALVVGAVFAAVLD